VPAPGNFQIIQFPQGGKIFVDHKIGISFPCSGKKIIILIELPYTFLDLIFFRFYPAHGREKGPVIIFHNFFQSIRQCFELRASQYGAEFLQGFGTFDGDNPGALAHLNVVSSDRFQTEIFASRNEGLKRGF